MALYPIPVIAGDVIHVLHNYIYVHGRVLWPKPVTTDDFIINTGHCRRLYTRFVLHNYVKHLRMH